MTPTLERTRSEDVGEALLRPSRFPGASLIWLVPLLAVAIAAWLVYTSIRDRGPIVTVSFESAEGLEPGKTKVKYKDVEIGTVGAVAFSADSSRIVVTPQMKAGTERFLHEDTRFWIVRPRIGVGGVSGLGTVISGAFVELDPGSRGTPRRDFVGLEEPPSIRSTVPGTRFELDAERLGGLSRGAPIYYRGIPVGQVLGHRLDPERRHVTIPIFVQAPHDRLLTRGTRFRDAGGVAFRTDGGASSSSSLRSGHSFRAVSSSTAPRPATASRRPRPAPASRSTRTVPRRWPRASPARSRCSSSSPARPAAYARAARSRPAASGSAR